MHKDDADCCCVALQGKATERWLAFTQWYVEALSLAARLRYVLYRIIFPLLKHPGRFIVLSFSFFALTKKVVVYYTVQPDPFMAFFPIGFKQTINDARTLFPLLCLFFFFLFFSLILILDSFEVLSKFIFDSCPVTRQISCMRTYVQ